MLRKAPHILITTPESLYILLTSPSGRELFRDVRTVIVDEIHTLAGSKRGVHLALSLERLQQLARQPIQRIGLSATIRPAGRSGPLPGRQQLAGRGRAADADRRAPSPSSTPATARNWICWSRPWWTTSAPWPATRSGRSSCRGWWSLIRQHRTTLIFVNNRRLAERAADWINEQMAVEGRGMRQPSADREGGQADAGRGIENRSTPMRSSRAGWPRGSGCSGPGAGLTPTRSARTTAACPRRRAWSWSRRSRRATCRRWSAPRRWSWASTSARWTWWCSSSRPRRWRRACSGSGAPAIWWARPPAGASSPPTGRMSWRRPRWPAACCGATWSPSTPRATRWTCWPSRSWPWSLWKTGAWTRSTTWCAAPTPTAISRPAPSTPCWPCSPAAIPARPTGSCAPGSSGTGSTTSWPRCPAPGCWR